MYGLGGSQASFSKISEEMMRKSREFMSSDLHNHQQHDQRSALLRYQSVPSSFIASLVDGNGSHLQSSANESETMFARMMPGGADSQVLQGIGAMKHEDEVMEEGVSQHNGYSNGSHMIYASPPLQQALSAHNSASSGTNLESPFRVMTSMAAANENSMSVKIGINGNSLSRQNSSPPGLFSENGFAATREMENLRNTANLNNHQINFTSGLSSCNALMQKMVEIGNETIEIQSPKGTSFGNSNSRCLIPSSATDYWNNSGFSSLKRTTTDNDLKMFSGLNSLETQIGSLGLSHHLSLPKSFPQIATIEKFLHFQDSVPCKIRAKRGCATHPRSIAERVRRTRISERMRKLQELFPNMDKQTNTADMLELAVEYIKDLQRQVKTLNDTKVKCTCSSV